MCQDDFFKVKLVEWLPFCNKLLNRIIVSPICIMFICNSGSPNSDIKVVYQDNLAV